MSINKIAANFPPIENLVKPGQGVGQAKEAGKTENSFSDMLGSALKEVNNLQQNADKQIEGLVLGDSKVSPHGAMIALEKADMAFQMMNSIRSKIIRAYEEIIRTQV